MHRLTSSPDRERLMSHIHEFSKRVKLSGSREEYESFLYLQQQMESYGYSTSLIQHDAYISLPGKARIVLDGKNLDCITHSMSHPSDPAGLAGELVYISEGTAHDYQSNDVAGKIVLISGIATEETSHLSRIHGVIGEIHISPNNNLYEMCVSPVWGSPDQYTRENLPAAVITTITQDDGAELIKRCEAGEVVTATLIATVDTGWRKTPILICELLPDNRRNETENFVLFSGHHDTWHFGVMDNGGANATMLEAARLLRENRADWQRGLRICFWSGHSHGRYSGSSWYADEYWLELNRHCVAHVNVDSTGADGAVILTNSAVIDELQSVASEAVYTETGQSHKGNRHGRAADQSFWGIGLPSIFGSVSHHPPSTEKMPTALGWWWHTPEDTAEHINPDNLIRDTRIVMHVLQQLLHSRILPFDYEKTANALITELENIQAKLQGRFDLRGLIEQALKLKTAAVALKQNIHNLSDENSGHINSALMSVSRNLVPLNYTQGDRYHHDNALPHSAWPALDGIRELANAAKPNDIPFYVVRARQTRNRIAHALELATEAMSGALPLISEN